MVQLPRPRLSAQNSFVTALSTVAISALVGAGAVMVSDAPSAQRSSSVIKQAPPTSVPNDPAAPQIAPEATTTAAPVTSTTTAPTITTSAPSRSTTTSTTPPTTVRRAPTTTTTQTPTSSTTAAPVEPAETPGGRASFAEDESSQTP